METTQRLQEAAQPSMDYSNWIIGAGALLLGFTIGSGRFSLLVNSAGKIAKNLGLLTYGLFSEAISQQVRKI